MIEKETGIQPEKIQEQKEYSFEEGVEETMKRINELLVKQEYVVVAIMGYMDVGKTTFTGAIMRELSRLNIPFITKSSADDLNVHNALQLKSEQKRQRCGGGVIILNAEDYGPFVDRAEEQIEKMKRWTEVPIRLFAQRFELPLSKIDLRIFLYRSDRQDGKRVKGMDIRIDNVYAKDKPRSWR